MRTSVRLRTKVSQALTILSLALFSFPLHGQTILRPGDLAVIGVNANLGGCGEGNVDLISFVCFRDITTGTLIDITDNGWERANPGQWGNSEGFVTVRRTGGTIPAGTVITFRLPPIGQSDAYQAVAPDGDWEFTQLSNSTLNFNSGGDQIYFMQGGEWDPGNDNIGDPQHDAGYDGGVILFGFNTKSAWNANVNDSQDSGLHPDVEPCYHMEPTGGTTDFISYTSPLDNAGQLEWIARISNPDNWTSYPDCPSYLSPPAALAIRPNDIDLACTVCSGCNTVQEEIRFILPEAGGPFTVVYTDGTNEYTASNVRNGDVDLLEVTKTLDFEIVSVEDINGCPVFSNFGPGATVTVESPPPAVPALMEACAEQGDTAVFNLNMIEEVVNLGSGAPVTWYSDAGAGNPISTPAAFPSPAATVFAVVGSPDCPSDPVSVQLLVIENPTLEVSVDQEVACSGFANGEVSLSISGGAAPYRIDWSDDAFDNQFAPDDLPAGTYSITITDRKGCEDSTTIVVGEPAPLVLNCEQSQPVSTIGASDGQAGITIEGGRAPYEVNWTGPASDGRAADSEGSLTIDNLPAGNYTLEVIDLNGCSISCFFTISDPACALNIDVSTQNVTCDGLDDGAVDLTITGGTLPLDIEWDIDRFDGMEDISGLPPGIYTVLVTDAAGCTATATATINADFPALSADISPGGTACPGECFGFLLNLSGTAPFTLTYDVRTGENTQRLTLNTGESEALLELCPADIGVQEGLVEVSFVELQDANCRLEINQTEFITLLEEPEFNLDTMLCAGDSLVINGVTYNASNPAGTEIISGGSVNGCDSLINVNLSFSDATERRIDSTLCEGASITVNGTLYDEGNPSGTEIIKGGAANGCDSLIIIDLIFEQAVTVDINTTLCEGDQLTVGNTVYDQNNPSGTERLQRAVSGCDSIVNVNLQFIPGATASLESGGSICPGDSTELIFRLSGAPSATIQYTDGVNPPVQLNDISDGYRIRVSPATTTTYTIDFILVNGASCPAGVGNAATVEVNDIEVAIENANDFDGFGVSCFGSTDGALRVVSTPDASTLNIQWSTGAATPAIDNLPPGDYQVSVSNDTGCEATESFTLTEPDAVIVQTRLIDPTCPGDTDGAVVVEAIDGGAPPYRFQINGSTSEPVGNLPFFIPDIGAGNYELTIRDVNDCTTTESFEVMPRNPLELELGPDVTIGRGDSVLLSPAANFEVDSFFWAPTAGLRDPLTLSTIARPAASITYRLTAFNPKGCRIEDQIRIVVEERSRLYIPNAFSPNNDGVNDRFSLFAQSGEVQSFTLRIFDRWGSLVFERDQMLANAVQDGWDGEVRGQEAHPGVYVYFSEITYTDGTEEIVSGEVLLIR